MYYLVQKFCNLEQNNTIISVPTITVSRTFLQIYQAVILPQLLYGVTAWYDRNSSNIPATERNKRARRLAALQNRAAVIISGAFKGTAAAALDVELYMQPMELQMERIAQETA